MTYLTIEEAQCLGKHQFPTYNIAKASIKRHALDALEVFKCPHCGFYHIGHAIPKQRNLKRAQK